MMFTSADAEFLSLTSTLLILTSLQDVLNHQILALLG
jgi:hypothetical protein